GLLDDVEQQFLKARVFPGRLFVPEAGVEDSTVAIVASPGHWPAVKAGTHPALLQVHRAGVELQQDVGGIRLEIADLVNLVVDLERGGQSADDRVRRVYNINR